MYILLHTYTYAITVYVLLRCNAFFQRVYILCVYSGTSLLRSTTGLGKIDFNGEVTLLQGVICTVEYNLGLSQGDCNWEVFLLVR